VRGDYPHPVPLGRELKRLARHSAIYGLGGLVSRVLAIFLLPLYASYLRGAGFGKLETIVALTTVLVIVLRLGISSAFFRFYFDTKDPARRVVVVRTSFWFTMGMATLGLVLGWIFASDIDGWLRLGDDPWLVRAAFVGLWAQMNYEQLTSLFRVEERSTAFVLASLTNVLITIGATVLLVVGLRKGATGAVVGNFVGTLTVYLVLLGYRRYQLGPQFDRNLLRQMNKFGLPLVPSALALWAINFIDRLFIAHFKDQTEVGVYSVAVRISSAIVFLMIAFRTAWPAFAYSIEDDREAKRTYAYVLTYLVVICAWGSLALGALAPWLVDVLAPKPEFARAAEAVAPLAFAATAYAAYTVIAIGSGRARKTQLNWVVSGVAAAVNIALNIALIPRYGMIGAAIATLVAYVALFAGMYVYAQHVYPVAYQRRRLATASGVAVALTVVARGLDVPLGVAILLVAVYPLALAPLRFYLPAVVARLRRLAPAR
jgi:O-antigen/teichoic acid export membrane protein